MRLVGPAFRTIREICEELKPMERAPRAYLLSGFSILLLAALFATGAKGFEAAIQSRKLSDSSDFR